MKVRIEIETKTFVRFWLVVLAFVVGLWLIASAKQALLILGCAFFLALILNGPVGMLANRLPGKSRAAGTAIAFSTVILLLGAFMFLVVPPVIDESAKVAQSIPMFVDQVQTQWHGLTAIAERYGLQDQVNQAFDTLRNNASGMASNWAANIGANVVASVGSLFGFMVAAFLVIVLTFLMLVEAPRWMQLIWGAYNDHDKMEHHRDLIGKMHNVVTGFVTGQLTVAALGGFFAGMTVFILSLIFSIPTNLALPAAAIVFILSMIPMFGATIAGVLICLLLGFNEITAAIIFAVYFLVYQQIENNFISPAIQSRTVELSPLAILASVTVGIYLFGIAGGIISIPIAGSIKVLLEDYAERAKKKRRESKNPIHKLVKKLQEEV